MPQSPHSFLIDLLATHGTASAHGCGLEPRLLEMLLDRHAQFPGTAPLNLCVRHDGPLRTHTCHQNQHRHTHARSEKTTQSQT